MSAVERPTSDSTTEKVEIPQEDRGVHPTTDGSHSQGGESLATQEIEQHGRADVQMALPSMEQGQRDEDQGQSCAPETGAPLDDATQIAAETASNVTPPPPPSSSTASVVEEEDIHSCARCKLAFTSLNKYIEHRLTHKDSTIQLSKSQMLLLKTLETAPGPTPRKRGRPRKRLLSETEADAATPVKQPKHESKYNRLKLYHNQEDVIASDKGYQCKQCSRSFRREAALRRHMDYDHRAVDSDDQEEGEVQGEALYICEEKHGDKREWTDAVMESVYTTVPLVMPEGPQAGDVITTESGEVINIGPAIQLVSATDDPDGGFTAVDAEHADGRGTQIQIYTLEGDPIESSGQVFMAAVAETEGAATHNVGIATGPAAVTTTSATNVVSAAEEAAETADWADDVSQHVTECEKDTPGSHLALQISQDGTQRLVYVQMPAARGKAKVPAAAADGSGGVAKADDAQDRPFHCRQCGKGFKVENVLQTHMLTHSERRDFVCPYKACKFSFKTKGSLKRHERRHTDERPFMCPLCGRSFRESGALTRHRRARTLCTQKTDAELPRYRKNLQLKTRGLSLGDAESVPPDPDDQPDPASVMHVVLDTEQPVPDPEGAVLMQQLSQDAVAVDDLKLSQPSSSHETAVLISEEGVICEVEATSLSEEVTEGTDEVNEVVNEAMVTVDGDAHFSEDEDMADEPRDSSHVDDHLHVCKVDGHVFPSEAALATHLKSHLRHIPHRCTQCAYATNSRRKLAQHLELAHHMENSALPDGVRTGSEDEHDGEGGVAMEIIKKDPDESSQDAEPNAPQQAEDGKKTKDATVAMRQLLELSGAQSRGSSNGHQGAGFWSSVKKCPVCQRCFRGQTYLRLHMRAHTGERPHKCHHCFKSFMTKDALTKHLTSHSEERNYKCGECGKLFKRISHVREHLKVHSNDRPFNCRMCGKAFKSVNACKVHMRTHIDVLPFSCFHCLKSFREKGSLERHVRTHTGEKPYICAHCGRRFAEHGTLNRHLKAKVPCTQELQKARLCEQTHRTVAPHGVLLQGGVTLQGQPASRQMELRREATGAETQQPTVLAEFSMVADTQQYIPEEGEPGCDVMFVAKPAAGQHHLGEDQAMSILQDGLQAAPVEVIIGSLSDSRILVFDESTGQHLELIGTTGDGQEQFAVISDQDVIRMVDQGAESGGRQLQQVQQQTVEHLELMADDGQTVEVLTTDPETGSIIGIDTGDDVMEGQPEEVIL